MYRVLLVDDEQIILKGLMKVVSWADYGCEVAGTASDGREGMKLIRDLRPDILFTDIRMPNLDGLEMIAAVKSEFPRMQVAVLTAFRDFDYAQKAIRLGVSRYLLKPSKMDEIKEAIQSMTQALAKLPPEEKAPEEDAQSASASFVVNAALQYIEKHCTEHLSLQEVAEHVYVSQWHLSKLINRYLNQSFFDIVNATRIEKSKALLKDPSLKVHEVADRVGYSDVAHFSKIFKKVVGRSPVEYRSDL